MATRKKKKSKKKQATVLACVLIVLLLILFVMVFVLAYMVMKEEVKNSLQNSPTPVPTVIESTPVPTVGTTDPSGTPVADVTGEPLATATATPTSGPDGVNWDGFTKQVETSISLELKEIKADLKEKGIEGVIGIETYDNNYFVSAVFKIQAGDQSYDKPVVYVKETGKEVKGSEFFRPTYFAVIQESIDVYKAYNSDDYEAFYIKNDKVYFYMNGEIGKMGNYVERDLTEANYFMVTNLEGEPVGYQVRTDLDRTKPMVAITFDDGPYQEVETTLLEGLNRLNARCTFFFVANRMAVNGKYNIQSAKALAAAGNEIASHTYSHCYFPSQSSIDSGTSFDVKAFWEEINKANLTIAEVIGYAPTIIRTPGGVRNNYMDNLPMARIHWSIDTRDWENRGQMNGETKQQAYDRKVQESYENIINNASDGQIILMHSLYGMSAEGALKAMEELSAKGYQFVTVTELAYYKGVKLEPGKCYSKIK